MVFRIVFVQNARTRTTEIEARDQLDAMQKLYKQEGYEARIKSCEPVDKNR
jgi:hypothetical protein